MNRIFQMAWKDLRILLRDKMGAFFIIGFPILMGLFFGLVMGPTSSSGGGGKMKIAVVDQDNTPLSKTFVDQLRANESIIVEVDNLDSAKTSVRKGNRVAALVVDKGFAETAGLFWEEPPTIQLAVDPSRAAESAMLEGFIMESIGQLAGERFQDLSSMTDFVERSREDLKQNQEVDATTRLALSTFFNSVESLSASIDQLQQTDDGDSDSPGSQGPGFNFVEMKSLDIRKEVDPNSIRGQLSRSKSQWDISFPQAMIWGILGCVAGFSISIARERSMGTMTRLRVAPVSQMEILLGKALACFLTSIFVVLMMTLFGVALGMKPDSFLLLGIAAVCVACCFVGIMMILALLGKTEQSVSGAGWAANMIMAMLGGCMIPVMFMPAFMQNISFVSPIRWAILALEGAIWREFTFTEMLLPCGILLSVGVVGLLVGTAMLKRSEE